MSEDRPHFLVSRIAYARLQPKMCLHSTNFLFSSRVQATGIEPASQGLKVPSIAIMLRLHYNFPLLLALRLSCFISYPSLLRSITDHSSEHSCSSCTGGAIPSPCKMLI